MRLYCKDVVYRTDSSQKTDHETDRSQKTDHETDSHADRFGTVSLKAKGGPLSALARSHRTRARTGPRIHGAVPARLRVAVGRKHPATVHTLLVVVPCIALAGRRYGHSGYSCTVAENAQLSAYQSIRNRLGFAFTWGTWAHCPECRNKARRSLVPRFARARKELMPLGGLRGGRGRVAA